MPTQRRIIDGYAIAREGRSSRPGRTGSLRNVGICPALYAKVRPEWSGIGPTRDLDRP
ncbi:protein of unknown function [Rhodovastum atsumiense]|nr:protein of unknown function [Rhodovastum atsumiense]